MRNTIPIMDLDNPDELIRANGAAEAVRTHRLREEVSDYAQMIEQLRELCDRNAELVQKLQFMNRSQAEEVRSLLRENSERISEKLSAFQGQDTKALQEGIAAAIDSSREGIVNSVRESMTASVQEAVELLLQEKLEQARDGAAAVVEDSLRKSEQKTLEQAQRLHQQSDDFNHRENVRVYRNIQASMISELGKQTQELRAGLDSLQEKLVPDPAEAFFRKAGFGILAAVLALQLLEGVGLLSLLLSLH